MRHAQHAHLVSVLSVAMFVLVPDLVSAMPMFTRRTHLPCSACHEAPTFPRLTDLGYRFRRAGFRLPEMIGQDEPEDFDLANYTAARIQTEYDLSHTSSSAVTPSTSQTTNTFQLFEVTLYPITGPFMRHWATETEISIAPDQLPEIENAYLRGVWGTQRFWFQARLGLFHPFEGFGGSDRFIGISRPLFETRGANHNQDTLSRIWGIDRVGAEVGLQWRNTSLNVALLNTINTAVEEGRVTGVGITRNAAGNLGKDLLVFANQILGARSGISAYWSHGTTRLPVDPAAFVAGTNPGTWDNVYDRLALFGSVGFWRLTALAGGMYGFDHWRDPATASINRFSSAGAFGEVDVALTSYLAAFGRFDYFDPDTSASSNTQLGGTFGASLFREWVYLVPEYQYRYNQARAGNQTTNTFIVRAIVLY